MRWSVTRFCGKLYVRTFCERSPVPTRPPPISRAGRFLLGDHPIEQARAEDLERLDLVLELRFLILAFHFEAGRQVRDADRAVGRVDALAARAAGAKHVDPQVFVFDLEVDFFGFRQNGDRRRGGVDASLLLSHGNTLHAVHAGLVAERAVRFWSARGEHRFLESAEWAFRE